MVIDTVAPWSTGGRESRYDQLLRRIASQKIDVTVYTMKWWDRTPSGPIRYRAITPRLPLYAGDRRSVVQSAVFALGTVQLLFRPFDVIQADHMPYLHLLPLRLIAWLRRVELVVDWHEYWGPIYWQTYLRRGARVAWAIERLAMRLPDVIIPVNVELAGRLIDNGVAPSRIEVVPNGVDRDATIAIPADARAPELIFVGRLMAHKRADLAVRALSALRESLPDCTLGIVGDGPELARLQSLARSLKLTDEVRFLGTYVRVEDLWSLVKGSRVLVFPSEREGFGLVVAESLSLGTPVVVVDGPANMATQLVEDGVTGSVLHDASPTSIADAVSSWIQSKYEGVEISDRFWRDHPDLDWNACAKSYAEILTSHARSRN